MFNIEISPAEITKEEARGLVALLMAVHGEDIVPASFVQVGQVARATSPINIVVAGGADAEKIGEEVASALAPDGYPADAAPAETPAVTGGDVERDKEGIPWDERIHAGTKTKTQAGIWTRRRNLDDATFDAVMAELRAANTARTIEAAQALTTPAETSAAEAFTPPASVTIAPATVPAPPAAAVPTPPAATPAPAPAPANTGEAPTFVEIMKKVTTGQSSGKLTQAALQENLAAVGLKNIGELAAPTAGDARVAFGAIIDAVLA